MASEYPPLNKIYVFGYSANDRDYPIVSLTADPRVAGYQVPKDLSACPDKRYPNHLFTGAQPISGDQRVRHVWEILPSPWVPFTRYDDDLGPVQGRRRSVKNEGQVATLSADKRTTYEGREGSAIVLTETEESWSIKTDANGNSLFPVKTRNFYDPSRGDVKETRQLIVATGKETATLVNVVVPEPSQRNRTIQRDQVIQTTYEPYNQFLSFKIVQTYRVAGPLLIGQSTNNEGQLVAVTTQRKNASGYRAPNPTATKTVEVNREDAASIVERVVDAPSVFPSEVRSIERPDNVPSKFRAKFPTTTTEVSIAGKIQTPTLDPTNPNILAKSEQQITEFVKRIRTTDRGEASVVIQGPFIPINIGSAGKNTKQLTGGEFTTELGGGYANVTEQYPVSAFGDFKTIRPEFGTISDSIENVGDGTWVRRQVKLPKNDYIFGGGWTDEGNVYSGESLPVLSGQEYDEELDIVIPYKQVVAEPSNTLLAQGKRRRVTPRDIAHSTVVKYNIEDIQDSLDEYYWEIPDMTAVQLPNKLISASVVTDKAGSSGRDRAVSGDTYSYSFEGSRSIRGNLTYDIEEGFSGNVPTIRAVFFLPKGGASPDEVRKRLRKERNNPFIDFWPNARPQSHQVLVFGKSTSRGVSKSVSFDSAAESESNGGSVSIDVTNIPPTIHGRISIFGDEDFNGIIDGGEGPSALVAPNFLPSTTPFAQFPTGEFIYQINASPYKFSYTRVDVLLVTITAQYV